MRLKDACMTHKNGQIRINLQIQGVKGAILNAEVLYVVSKRLEKTSSQIIFGLRPNFQWDADLSLFLKIMNLTGVSPDNTTTSLSEFSFLHRNRIFFSSIHPSTQRILLHRQTVWIGPWHWGQMSAAAKIAKVGAPDETDLAVAQALYDLETNMPDLRKELRPLQFNSAREVPFPPTRLGTDVVGRCFWGKEGYRHFRPCSPPFFFQQNPTTVCSRRDGRSWLVDWPVNSKRSFRIVMSCSLANAGSCANPAVTAVKNNPAQCLARWPRSTRRYWKI